MRFPKTVGKKKLDSGIQRTAGHEDQPWIRSLKCISSEISKLLIELLSFFMLLKEVAQMMNLEIFDVAI